MSLEPVNILNRHLNQCVGRLVICAWYVPTTPVSDYHVLYYTDRILPVLCCSYGYLNKYTEIFLERNTSVYCFKY